jgi:hypothetical protein
MILLAFVLSLAAVAFLCWLLFNLAVYALPVFAGLTAGLAAWHAHAGLFGALTAAILAAGLTLALARFALAASSALAVRAGVGLLFAIPAAVAGYQATFGLGGLGSGAIGWRVALAVVGAVAVGGTAWIRMTRGPGPTAPGGGYPMISPGRGPRSEIRAAALVSPEGPGRGG